MTLSAAIRAAAVRVLIKRHSDEAWLRAMELVGVLGYPDFTGGGVGRCGNPSPGPARIPNPDSGGGSS